MDYLEKHATLTIRALEENASLLFLDTKYQTYLMLRSQRSSLGDSEYATHQRYPRET
jgi:hypothetical protein